MRIGILSDTHDKVDALRVALDIFKQEDITQLIHCGDMTSADTTQELAGFDVIYVSGNMDFPAQSVAIALRTLNPNNQAHLNAFTGELGGARIAVAHGHLHGVVDQFAHSGEFDYVLHGHTHLRRDEMAGGTRILNPGALGGVRHEHRSICLLDLDTGDALFIQLVD